MPKNKSKTKAKSKISSSHWFYSGEPLNWRKEDSQARRRQAALASRGGKYLPTAKALMALSNVTRDLKTKRLARADSLYFYALYKKSKDKGSK